MARADDNRLSILVGFHAQGGHNTASECVGRRPAAYLCPLWPTWMEGVVWEWGGGRGGEDEGEGGEGFSDGAGGYKITMGAVQLSVGLE